MSVTELVNGVFVIVIAIAALVSVFA